MGLLSFIKRLMQESSNFQTSNKLPPQDDSLPVEKVSSADNSNINHENESKKLSYSEKELLAVQRTTQADVLCLTGFPYSWNTNIQKFIVPNGHPFVYMNIIGSNITVAKDELTKMNECIKRDRRLCDSLPRNLSIPIYEIVFTPQVSSGYSRLMCTPVTYDGSLSDVPIALSFMTDLEKDRSTHGDIYYDRSGNICKAELYFWRDDGYFLYYATVDNELVLERVELALSLSGSRITVYKGAHIIAAELALEAKRREEENAFQWLQLNIPDKCPKTVTGYRRMKTQNTKNYQALKALAATKGKEI